MEDLTGTTLPVFLGVTVILFSGAAVMTGYAIADTWRPAWHNLVYGIFLGFADRLVSSLLFGSELLSLPGYLVDTAVLIAAAFFAYRVTLTHKMVSQYPWLYERGGLFSWKDRAR